MIPTKGKPTIFLWLIILICIQTTAMFLFCTEKDGFHLDEGFTLAINGDIDDGEGNIFYYYSTVTDEWKNPSSFSYYYSVSDENRFNYSSVYQETILDGVHPPLYYFVLFTLESLLPTAVTKWYGLIINLLFFVATLIVLWCIGIRLFNNAYFALAPLFLYGFSFGAVNTVIYIRMYAMVSFFIVAFLLALFLLIIDKPKLHIYAILAFVGFCGVMTHYYFILFAVPVVLIYIVWLALQKRWKLLFSVVAAGVCAVAAMLIAHPSFWWQMTGSYRSVEALASLSASHSDAKFIAYFEIFCSSIINVTFGTAPIAVIIGAVAFILIVFLWSKLRRDKRNSDSFRVFLHPKKVLLNPRRFFCGLLIVSSGFYIILITSIAPYWEDRYLMMLFPILSLLIAALYYAVAKRFRLPVFALPAATVVFLIIVGISYIGFEENYLYKLHKQSPEIRDLREQMRDVPAVATVLEETHWELHTLLPELILYKPNAPVYINNFSDIGSYPDELYRIIAQARQLSQNGKVMLFIEHSHFDVALIAEQLVMNEPFTSFRYLYSVMLWDVYIVS